MRVLKAAARQEILDVLAGMGTVSISELAEVLDRPADSLYYHIRLLQKAGLVHAAGTRGSGVNEEALYCTVASDLRLSYEPGAKGNAKSVVPIVDSMLRLTSRDFQSAFEQEETEVDGTHRELWATRTTGWLTKDQVAEVNRHIQALLRTTAESSSAEGRLYALTMVLTPLNRKKAQKAGTRKSSADTRNTKSNIRKTAHPGNHASSTKRTQQAAVKTI